MGRHEKSAVFSCRSYTAGGCKVLMGNLTGSHPNLTVAPSKIGFASSPAGMALRERTRNAGKMGLFAPWPNGGLHRRPPSVKRSRPIADLDCHSELQMHTRRPRVLGLSRRLCAMPLPWYARAKD